MTTFEVCFATHINRVVKDFWMSWKFGWRQNNYKHNKLAKFTKNMKPFKSVYIDNQFGTLSHSSSVSTHKFKANNSNFTHLRNSNKSRCESQCDKMFYSFIYILKTLTLRSVCNHCRHDVNISRARKWKAKSLLIILAGKFPQRKCFAPKYFNFYSALWKYKINTSINFVWMHLCN